jgi:hypothetical protein
LFFGQIRELSLHGFSNFSMYLLYFVLLFWIQLLARVLRAAGLFARSRTHVPTFTKAQGLVFRSHEDYMVYCQLHGHILPLTSSPTVGFLAFALAIPVCTVLVFLAPVFDCTLGYEGEGPKYNKRERYRRSYSDGDLLAALRDVCHRGLAPAVVMTRNKDIPRSTFYRKVKQRLQGLPVLAPSGRPLTMTVAEEMRLLQWIHENAARGFALDVVSQ